MKILVSTHHLLRYSGTETYTLTLVRSLSKLDHQITLYSHYLNDSLSEFSNIKNVHLVNCLECQTKKNFDIIHVHHQINAIEARYLFPNTPIIFQSHGVKPFLEQPPITDLNISQFLAISQEVSDNLTKHKVPKSKISFFGNIFDPNYFYPISPINKKIEKALVFSNYNHPNKDTLLQTVCDQLNIKLDFVGGIYGEIAYDQINTKLNQYDIVFTIGRGAVETMLSGRTPFIIDDNNFNGFVTPQNYHNLKKVNFSGRYNPTKSTVNNLKAELLSYNPNNVDLLTQKTTNEYSSDHQINKLIKIYLSAITTFKTKNIDLALIENIYKVIQTTRDYEKILFYDKTLELEILRKSKIYKLYKYWHQFKSNVKT